MNPHDEQLRTAQREATIYAAEVLLLTVYEPEEFAYDVSDGRITLSVPMPSSRMQARPHLQLVA